MGVFMVTAYRSLPILEGESPLRNLQQRVQIERDGRGFVTIKASSQEDAYQALGYVHAQDRLWQMEETRLIGAGRLGEVLGPLGTGFDRFIRTFDFYGRAKAQRALLLPGAQATLRAYTQGVNAWLETRDRPLPPEFQALFHTPEPWTEIDALVWGQLMSFTLSGNWRSERTRERWSRYLTPDMLDDILPSPGAEDPVTLSSAAKALLDLAVESPLTSASASNAWILSGEHTETGFPILANDPHLSFSAPNLWYYVRIEAPGLKISGVTVPGVPFHILGHTDKIAWGMTTTYADTQDLFVETINEDGTQVKTPNGWVALKTRREVIKNRFGADQDLVVRETSNGPLISDLWPEAVNWGDTAIALAFAAHKQPDTTPNALYLLNRAQDLEGFIEAAQLFKAPVQNLHFADVEGNIGLVAAGVIPVRKGGKGLLPADGGAGTHDWTGYLSFDVLPQLFNPATGWIRNANNQIVPDDYPYLISRDHQSGHRARRIDELWNTRSPQAPHKIEDSMRWQLDTLSTSARDVLPTLLAHLQAEKDNSSVAAVLALKNWDGHMDFDDPAPLIYATWSHMLGQTIAKQGFLAKGLDEAPPRYWRDRDGFILNALENPEWCRSSDTKGTSRAHACDTLVRSSFREAIKVLNQAYGDNIDAWSWKDAHRADFEHRIFGKIPLLNHLFDREVATLGDDNTLHRGLSIPDQVGGFRHIHGSGYRAIYDLSDLDSSRFSLAIGQSGHFLSPHYDDLMQDWAEGSYFISDGRSSDGKSSAKPDKRILTLIPSP